MAIALLDGEVDVIHADHLAAVDVNDLLVHQVTFEQQESFRTVQRLPLAGRRTRLHQHVADRAHIPRMQHAIPTGGADNQCGKMRGIILWGKGYFAHSSGERARGIDHGRTQQLRKCEIRHHWQDKGDRLAGIVVDFKGRAAFFAASAIYLKPLPPRHEASRYFFVLGEEPP